MQRDVLLTPEGLDKLKEEIEHLSTVKRREVAERIKEAREFGDISENSEYDDAKNEQAMLEARIAQLEEKLRVDSGAEYIIVGSTEADPRHKPPKVSNESPVGQALIGHRKGETVTVQLPKGPKELKITDISVA